MPPAAQRWPSSTLARWRQPSAACCWWTPSMSLARTQRATSASLTRWEAGPGPSGALLLGCPGVLPVWSCTKLLHPGAAVCACMHPLAVHCCACRHAMAGQLLGSLCFCLSCLAPATSPQAPHVSLSMCTRRCTLPGHLPHPPPHTRPLTPALAAASQIHTPDSSRYWLADTYAERHAAGQEPQNIDKEFLRLWFRARCDPYKDQVGGGGGGGWCAGGTSAVTTLAAIWPVPGGSCCVPELC